MRLEGTIRTENRSRKKIWNASSQMCFAVSFAFAFMDGVEKASKREKQNETCPPRLASLFSLFKEWVVNACLTFLLEGFIWCSKHLFCLWHLFFFAACVWIYCRAGDLSVKQTLAWSPGYLPCALKEKAIGTLWGSNPTKLDFASKEGISLFYWAISVIHCLFLFVVPEVKLWKCMRDEHHRF